MIVRKTIRLQDLGLELRMISEKIAASAQEAMSLDNMVLTAMAMCPVDTGALMSSVRAERRGPLETALMAGGMQYTNPRTGLPVDYARYVHDGTATTPARPFLLLAVLIERERVLRQILEGTAERT